MTHYWWMHWFWITLWISNYGCKDVPSTLHSNSPDLPFKNTTNSSYVSTRTTKNPLTTILPFTTTRNITSHKNVSQTKSTKPSYKKTESTVWPLNTTSKNLTKEIKETVITNKNITDPNNNLTDNQLLINSSFNAIYDTNNVTYLREEVNKNLSLVQNSQRINIEEGEDEIEISGGNLSAAGITGITLACVIVVGIICGISYFIYHIRGSNRPQVLNDRCSNPDSSGYIDDASVRDNSEEMYSLDNDSFLNSLEAMTIQNYWTDTVKHTKL